MFKCFRSQKREISNKDTERLTFPFNQERINQERKEQKPQLYVKTQPLIKNENLDPRDERILIPFDRVRCGEISTLDVAIIDSVTEWLVQANYIITSRGFRHLMEGKLTQIQSKAFTSRNMLLNIKELVGSLSGLKEQLKQQLMVKINAVQTEILSQLMLKYPQGGLRGASKRIRNIVKKIDNRANNQYDFLYKNDIFFQHRPDGHYASDVMRALNKMISFSSEVFQPVEGTNDSQDSYFEVWAEIVEYLVTNDAQKNEKSFFEGFDNIYTYTKEEDDDLTEIELVDKLKENMELEKSLRLSDLHRKRLKISHKIPIEANLFTEEQVESGQCKIRNSSVLRVIAKWTYELLQKLTNPKQLILHRAQKFKIVGKKLYSLQNNQKLALYEAATKERQRVQQYIGQLKREYILLQTLFAEEKTKNRFSNQDADLEVYALRIRQVYSQCLFKLLCRLIHSLKKVPKEASEIYFDRYQNSLPEDELKLNYELLRQVDLVSFKVGDLIRARYSSSESEFLRIYKNMIEISEKRPQILKIIRIKNRLDHKQNDIMINVFFMGKIQCQLQLSFDRTDQEDAKKSKLYSSYNHFIYEIRRSLLGPIGQFACILGQHDPVISQYVMMDKNNTLIEKNVLLQQMPQAHNKQEMPKKISDMFLAEVSASKINVPNNPNRQITQSLKDIQELLFLCQKCGEFKKTANFSLVAQRKSTNEGSQTGESQRQTKIRQCKQCFLAKLEEATEQNRIHYLLTLIFGEHKEEEEVLYKHLLSWDEKAVPIRFRQEQLHQYLPREGFMLSKDSRVLSFHYFRTFMDDDYVYFASKNNGQVFILAKISKILNEDDILAELTSITKRYFFFKFDNNVSIQDGSSFGFGQPGQIDAGLCKRDCCKQPVALGQGVEWREFNETINKQVIRKILEEYKNVMYLSKRMIGNMVNQLVGEDKRYDRACRAITIIEAQDSHLIDIRFSSKMINLSDIYIRYNNDLISLKGIQQCKNLKILYCNQCKIKSVRELSALVMLEELFVNQNEIETIEGLEKCVNLKEFSCYWNKISTLQPIKGCKNLWKLDIGYNLITTLKPLSSLLKLKNLSTSKNQLSTLEGIQYLSNLQVIDFSHTPISDPKLIEKCPKIQRIYCSNTRIYSLGGIVSPNLLELDIGQCRELTQFDLSRISCSTLEQLTADKCWNMEKLKNIEYCTNLKEFLLQENPRLLSQEFMRIGKCKMLEQLNISGNKSVNTLFFLQGLPKLNIFSCAKCEKLSNVSFLSLKKCLNLQTLNISENKNLYSTDFLKTCTSIYHLNLSGTGIRTFDKSFTKLRELRYLQLKDMHELQIQNFEFLKESSQIEKIVVDEIYDIFSLQGVECMTKLKELHIGKIRKADQKRYLRLEGEVKKFPIKIQRSIRLDPDNL